MKLSVCSLIDPDNTSNATICRRAGGARSAIGAVFALLLVGQPFGPGAVPLRGPFVAATPAAARTASASTVTTEIIRGLGVETCRNVGCQGNRSMVSSSVDWALTLRRLSEAKSIPQQNREGRRRNPTLATVATVGPGVVSAAPLRSANRLTRPTGVGVPLGCQTSDRPHGGGWARRWPARSSSSGSTAFAKQVPRRRKLGGTAGAPRLNA